MRVLLFHPVKLPPKNYGGTERVVLWLARALVGLGHEVSVVCLEGSVLPEGVVALPVPSDRVSPESFFGSSNSNLNSLRPIFSGIASRFDVVHFMAPPSEEFLKTFQMPYLVTAHGNGKKGEIFPANTCFLSQDHASRHGRGTYVYNGIDPLQYEYREKKKNHFLFLSKTSWKVKNLEGALDLVDLAGEKLHVTGGYRPVRLLFRTLFSSHSWIGPVAEKEKAYELAEARGLVFPILWDEPFGLVVVEALISGTPVVAPRRGSLSELVSEPVGALYSSQATLEEQVDALRSLSHKKSSDCRDWVLEKFTHVHMAQNYLALYEKILNGETLK